MSTKIGMITESELRVNLESCENDYGRTLETVGVLKIIEEE